MGKGICNKLLAPFMAALFLLYPISVAAQEPVTSPISNPVLDTAAVIDSGEAPTVSDSGTAPAGKPDSPEDSVNWEEVSTFEELVELLQGWPHNGSGNIRLTNDITIPLTDETLISHDGVALHLDVGSYTLYVEGILKLQRGLTVSGRGGENGLVRVLTGGQTYINDAVFKADEGYAVWQEEGAILTYTPTDECTGAVHYAEKAVAQPDSYISWQVATPVAVVHDGQALSDVLPKTDCVWLYHNGTGTSDQEIPVVWDLEHYQTQLDNRERVLITGTYPDAVAFRTPVCLVAFQNGNPAVITDCYGVESYGWPSASVKIELMEPLLACRFEWSQDGETWLPANAKITPTWNNRLAYKVTFPQDEPPAYPYSLSAVVEDANGLVGFSNVVVIYEAATQSGSGGNRGGGTGIGPPALPPIGGNPDGGDEGLGTSPESPDGILPPAGGNPNNPDHPTTKPSGGSDDSQSEDYASKMPSRYPAPDQVLSPPPIVSAPSILLFGQTNGQPLSSDLVESMPQEKGTPTPSSSQKSSIQSPVFKEPATVTMADVEVRESTAKQSPSSAKAVAQVVAGAVATVGIITLSMTSSGWSKRITQWIRHLLKR